jgi:hypothetical protein
MGGEGLLMAVGYEMMFVEEWKELLRRRFGILVGLLVER